MKTYEAVFNPETTDGVFSISLVQDPAMEGNFITLSKQIEVKFAEVDKEQRILMGLVLEPDKLVYRNQGGEEFNMVFSKDTIRDLAHNFFKQGFQKNSTIEHNEDAKINDVTFVESWIVEDPKNDKSNAFGFNYPKGSWIASMKVDDENIWEDYVKTGKVQGFSIDAFINLKEVKLNKNSNKMAEEQKKEEDKANILEDLKLWFTKNILTQKVELGTVKTVDGNVEIYFEGEQIKQDATVWSQTEDGERVSLPSGEYETEMGIIMVSEEGTVTEIKQKEEMTDETQTAQPSNDELTNAIKSLLIKYNEDHTKITDSLKVEFKKELDTLKGENKELSDKLVELSKTDVHKAKRPPVQKTYEEMTNYEKAKFNRGR